jgi:DNA-binding response OmpR family regulator
MPSLDFSQVHALVAVDDSSFGKKVADSFRSAGFASVAQAGEAGTLQSTLAESVFDLILITPHLNGGFIASIIRDMRDGRLGHHPFPIVITLLPAADTDLVRRVIDCGPDDIVVMPIETTALMSRVASNAQQRKPFIITGSFTGPDRRKDIRPGAAPAPQIEPPNPLAARVRRVPDMVLRAQISQARLRLDAVKVERYTVEIGWLERAISQMARDPNHDQSRLDIHLARLVQIADDLPRRLPDRAAPRVKGAAANFASNITAALNADRHAIPPLAAACAGFLAEFRGETVAAC